MDLERVLEAGQLLGVISAEEWVERFGRDLVETSLSSLAGGSDSLANALADALRNYERSIGGGSAERGRQLLSQKSGRIKATPMRIAVSVTLYCAIRLAMLRHAAKDAANAEARKLRLHMALQRLESCPQPEGLDAEQLGRVRAAHGRLRRALSRFGLLPGSDDPPSN